VGRKSKARGGKVGSSLKALRIGGEKIGSVRPKLPARREIEQESDRLSKSSSAREKKGKAGSSHCALKASGRKGGKEKR